MARPMDCGTIEVWGVFAAGNWKVMDGIVVGMVRRCSGRVALVASMLGLLGGLANPAAASVCTPSSVAAVSKSAYFQFAAVSQARATWSGKVARAPNLGKAFAHWRLARDRRVTCRQIAQRYRCVVVAQPCRLGRAGGNLTRAS